MLIAALIQTCSSRYGVIIGNMVKILTAVRKLESARAFSYRVLEIKTLCTIVPGNLRSQLECSSITRSLPESSNDANKFK